LKAVGYHLDQLPTGRYRFRCWLPRGAQGNELVEGQGPSESEAVRLCLASASCPQALSH
jgi:hypothetical protein